MDLNGFFRWMAWGQHWFDLLLIIAFLYLFGAVERLRIYDDKRRTVIENRAKLVAGLAAALIVAKWVAYSSQP